ncbi:MAG: hypothetical protein KAH38_09490, partial [Candidatus Hydrogenedentes bacterium]|nr:hypothetical protein [Candidatus Hydrogenedentota bacterium]
NALAAFALLRLAIIFGEKRYEQLAEKTLAAAAPMMQRAPAGFLTFILASDLYVHGATEITLAGDSRHPTMTAFRRIIGEQFIPNRLIMYAGEEERKQTLPVIEGREAMKGLPTAWVCRNRVCFAPAATPEELVEKFETPASVQAD